MNLLEALIDRPKWQSRGACRGSALEGSNIFYEESGNSFAEARKVCNHCPVKGECLRWALERGERFGMWGGKSQKELQVLRGENHVDAAH